MTGDRSTWASGFGLPADTAEQFKKVAVELDLSAASLIGATLEFG